MGSLVQVEAQDLAVLSFEEQVRLVGESSIIVGMHGAGEVAFTAMITLMVVQYVEHEKSSSM